MAYNCPECQHAIEDAIPKSRLDKEIEKRKQAQDEAREAQTALSSAKSQASLAAKHQERADALAKQVEELQNGHQVELTMVRHGVDDPELREAFGSAYSSLEVEGDKPDFGAWFDGLVADPSTAPKLLQPWVPKAASEEAPAAPQAASRPKPPAANASGTNSTHGDRTPGALTGREFRKPDGSFDVEAYRASRDQVKEQLTRQ